MLYTVVRLSVEVQCIDNISLGKYVSTGVQFVTVVSITIVYCTVYSVLRIFVTFVYVIHVFK